MPLPKLPTRPAAILTFPSGETARAQARTPKTAAARSNTQAALAEDDEDELLMQPELEGMAAPARNCLLYTSPSPRDKRQSRMPSSA